MRKNILVLIGILVLVSLGGYSLAEDSEKVDLEKITVTASRIVRGLLEVPANVSVICEREIKQTKAKNVPHLLKDLEGIQMYDTSGIGTSGRVNMRGFWGGMSTHHLVLVDGVPQNESEDKLVDWALISLDNVERIEVVRGPNSALYGDNAMSGVINIITKEPSIKRQTIISNSYGSFETENYKLSTSGRFKKIGYYFNAGGKSTEGFRTHSDYEDWHLNGKLDFPITQKQKLKFYLDYYDKERGALEWAITEAQIKEDRHQARPGSENDKNESEKLNLAIAYHNDISKTSNIEGKLYYRHQDSESFYTSGSSGSSTVEQIKDEDVGGMFLGLNINPEIFGIKQTLTFGSDLEKDNFDYEEFSAPYQARGNTRKDYYVKRYKYGPYLQGEINIFESLKLIAGLRYDRINFDFNDQRTQANSKKKRMWKVTPKYGLVYNYSEGSNLYANYAESFRTPTIAQMFTYGSMSNIDLNPEEAVSYELGMHHKFNDNLKMSAVCYWMGLDNEIWYDYATSKYDNIGETLHKGIETRLDLEILKGLSSFLNYTYTRAKNKSGTNSGNYLNNIPLHKGSLGLKLETVFGLTTSLYITRVGSCYLDSANQDKLDSYITSDLRIDYNQKWWSVFWAIDNLFGKEYNSYGFKSGNTQKFNPAPERTFTFGAELKF